MLTDQQVLKIATDVLQAQLGLYGFTQASVRSGYDHDGESALFVAAAFDTREIAPGEILAETINELQDALIRNGETRFAYLSYEYEDDFPEEAAAVDRGTPRFLS